jgi:hypothetical protein
LREGSGGGDDECDPDAEYDTRPRALVAGSGIGDAGSALPWMSGSWAVDSGHSLTPMPFDGVLMGSRVMVAKEARTSHEVKELLVATPGMMVGQPGEQLRAITALITYAKAQIESFGLQISVSTRQRWDVLAGVGNTTPGYATTRQAILDLLAACDGFVYADIYPYFDPGIAAAIGPSPTQAQFTAAVTASFDGSYSALGTAFSSNGVTAAIRIGETGWPTSGSQPAQPNASIANPTYAQWHYEAISAYLASNSIKGFVFEAYDEPWKGDQAGDNSEAFFGIWTAQGTAPTVSQFTLTGETQKYLLTPPKPPKPPQPNGCLGTIGAGVLSWLFGLSS